MPQLIPTRETPTHIFYQAHYDGQLIKLIKDKATDEVFFDAHSVALALGYPSQQAMLADEHALAAMREYAQESGDSAIRILDEDGNPVLP